MLDLCQKLIINTNNKSIIYSRHHPEYWIQNSKWKYWLNTILRRINAQYKCKGHKQRKQLIYTYYSLYDDISKINIEIHDEFNMLIQLKEKFISFLCEFIATCSGQILIRKFKDWFFE